MRIPTTIAKREGYARHTAAKGPHIDPRSPNHGPHGGQRAIAHGQISDQKRAIGPFKAHRALWIPMQAVVRPSTPHDGQPALPSNYDVHRSCLSSKGRDADFGFAEALTR